MEKYRIAFTVQDFYDYVGINPYCGIKEHILRSIPEEFKQNGYNIKFKRLHSFDIWYRIHMSVRMTEEEIQKVFEKYRDRMFGLYNTSYKLITKHF